VAPDDGRGAPESPPIRGSRPFSRETSRADPGGPSPGRRDEPMELLYEMTNGFVPLMVSAVNGVLVQLPLLRP
jgi:hypothetical protein